MEEAMKEVKDRKKKKLDQKLSRKQDKPKQAVKQPKKGGPKGGKRWSLNNCLSLIIQSTRVYLPAAAQHQDYVNNDLLPS